MSTYKFMEMAFHNPQNRKHFFQSAEAMKKPFLKEYRYTELWRSMFLYRNDSPNEEDPMFGNFYLECDVEDFQVNRSIMLDASDYLNKKFKIPYVFMDLFYTNRSIWLSIPAKVFGCFGSIKLNLIYKQMATEIDNYLKGKGYKNPLDLSIYKWNGLIHSLGSYLRKSSRWVTKFSYYDLDNAVKEDDVIKAKYDNFFNLSDIEMITEAKEWYQTTRLRVIYNQHSEKKDRLTQGCKRQCMSNLEELGYIEENRNLHIYSYSLHLKELGYNTQEAVEKVKNTFDMDYVNLRECERTVKSAIEGNKRFNCTVVKQLLNPDLFDCNNCGVDTEKEKDTFILPRLFIEKLQKGRVHYDTYKYLLYIVQHHQKFKSDYTYSLKGEKYKKLIVSRFKKIEELGIVKCSMNKDSIVCKLNKMNYDVYQSHIVIPNRFLEDKRFHKMKNEIKVLLKLWRSSLLGGSNSNSLFFNVKYKTLIARLKMTIHTLIKLISKLKKDRLVFGKKLFTFFSIKEARKHIKKSVQSSSKKNEKNKFSTVIKNTDIEDLGLKQIENLGLFEDLKSDKVFLRGTIYI